MITGKTVFDKRLTVVAIGYLLACAVLLYVFGIQLGGEADKFVENANHLIKGERFFNGVFGYFYIGYIFLVAVFIKFSVNLVFVAVLQIILSFVAALCIHKLLLQTLKNHNIAFLFFVAYLLCYPIQKWNFYLYSESLHTSLGVIGIYFLNRWINEKTVKQFIFFGIILLLILFSRPVGLLFLISVFATLMFWLWQNKKKIQFYVLAAVSIVSLIIVLNSPFTAFVNPDSIRRMEVICQVPEANTDSSYKEYNRDGLYKAFAVIKNEIGFGNFFKIGFKKLACFFGMYRNYYSWQHNLLLVCFTIFYPFALIGLFSKCKREFYYTRLFIAAYLIFTSTGIFFTCDEWSNRFISPAFPFVLILAAGGFLSVYKKNI